MGLRLKKRTLTISEHKQLGEDLKRIRDTLLSWSVKLRNTYGVASHREKLPDKALKAVDTLRCVMDGRLSTEWPEDFSTFIYYPGPKED